MLYQNVTIESMAYHLPEEILSSAEIEVRLKPFLEKFSLEPGALEKITGIQERRIWPLGTKPSTLSAAAGKKAIEKSGIDPNKIDLLIHSGVCRDGAEPSTSSLVHNLLDLSPHCMVFDVSNACLGFLNAMLIAANMIELGQIENALIVTGENAGPIYPVTIEKLLKDQDPESYRKSLASLTLGSAAVSYVLSKRKEGSVQPRLLGGTVQIDSKSAKYCQGRGDIHHQEMETDTAQLMKYGLILGQITWEYFKRDLSWDNDSPQHIFPHQVSKSHQKKVFELLHLDQKKSCSHLEYLGNTGSAATPLTLAFADEKGSLKKGDKIALLGIGSGINCLMLGLQW